jgi:hypothetical protein
MREDLGGDPAQMRIIWYHMRSPGVTRPHRAASGYGYAGIPAWQAEWRAMVNAKAGRGRSRITRLPRRLAVEATAANRTQNKAQSFAVHTRTRARRLIVRMADVNGRDLGYCCYPPWSTADFIALTAAIRPKGIMLPVHAH